MNFEIEQKVLLEHLNYVIKGISTKNLIPILNCIKMDLTNEGLFLLSTNNDIAIKTFISSKKIKNIKTPGTIVVYGKYLFEIIRKLPDEIINIEEVLEDKINIYTTKSSFYLNCNRVEDFPTLNLEENNQPIKLNNKVLKNIINQTIFATSNEESRPTLTGLNLQIKDNHLVIEMHIIVAYGVNISTVCTNLVSSVKYKVENFTGMTVDKVNVCVESVRVID